MRIDGSLQMDYRPLLKRAFLCLQDGENEKADALLERVLDADPEQAMAYVGKLMLRLGAAAMEDLPHLAATPHFPDWHGRPLEDDPDFQKAMKYADDALRAELIAYNARSIELALQYAEEVRVEMAAAEVRRQSALKEEEKRRRQEKAGDIIQTVPSALYVGAAIGAVVSLIVSVLLQSFEWFIVIDLAFAVLFTVVIIIRDYH